MSRLDELKAKIEEKGGYFGLEKDEQDEYTKLNKAAKPVAKPSGKVEIESSMLAGILDRLKQLEAEKKEIKFQLSDGEIETVTDNVGVKTATLRVYQGKYVVDWKDNRKQWNEKLQEMENIYDIFLLLGVGDGEHFNTEKVEVTLTEMSKLDRVEVSLLDKKEDKKRKSVGKTQRADVDYSNFKTTYGEEVPMYVSWSEIKYKVQLPDGRVIELDQSRLNG